MLPPEFKPNFVPLSYKRLNSTYLPLLINCFSLSFFEYFNFIFLLITLFEYLYSKWFILSNFPEKKDSDKNEGHKVMKFNVLQASVRAYQRNLNTHSSYKAFRQARAKLRDLGEPLDSIILSEYLDKYAETGNEYVKVLQKIIQQNNLKDFDDAKLLPSSIELESLI